MLTYLNIQKNTYTNVYKYVWVYVGGIGLNLYGQNYEFYYDTHIFSLKSELQSDQ
jgi:predicted small secreted protein